MGFNYGYEKKNRTTEGPRLKKARNIKENHRSDD